MRTNLTKQPSWLAVATFILLAGMLMFRFSTGDTTHSDVMATSPLGALLESIQLPSWLYVTLSIASLALSGILTLVTITRHGLALVYAPLPMVLFLLVGFFIVPQADPLCSALLSLMVLWSINQFIPVFQRQLSMQRIFACNFILGVTALLYPPVLPFSLVFCVMAARFHYSANVVVVSLLGVILPLILASWVWWLAGEPFLYVFDSIKSAFANGSLMSFIELIPQDYYLHGVLALGFLIGIFTFMAIKKTISFTLLITAKYAQDGLLALSFLAIIELLLGWADGAIFPILGVVTTPLLYQLYSKKHGKMATLSYITLVILAISTCLV